MHTASQALAIERQASAQPSLAERVSRPKTRAILGLMRLNFLSVGDGKFIHSPRSGSEVRVEDMRQSYWQRRFDGARRVTPAAGTQVGQVDDIK